MADLLYVVTLIAAFGAFAGLVRLCDRIVGGNEGSTASTPVAVGRPQDEEVGP